MPEMWHNNLAVAVAAAAAATVAVAARIPGIERWFGLRSG